MACGIFLSENDVHSQNVHSVNKYLLSTCSRQAVSPSDGYRTVKEVDN